MSEETNSQDKKPFLHPAAGALVLGVDWLFFSGTVFSGGAGIFAAATLGFLAGLIGVTYIQRNYANEDTAPAVMKGLLSGIAIGLPFPVFGTLLGGAVLAMSGLDQMRDRAARAVAESAKKRLTGSDEEPPKSVE